MLSSAPVLFGHAVELGEGMVQEGLMRAHGVGIAPMTCLLQMGVGCLNNSHLPLGRSGALSSFSGRPPALLANEVGSIVMASISDDSSALRPLCPVRSELVAVNACERCGRYFCSHCGSSVERCQECLRRYVAASPSSEVRARRATLSLRMVAVLAVGQMLLNLWAILVPGARESFRSMETLVTISMFLNGVGLVLFPLTTVAYLMWMQWVVRQMNAWGTNVGASPAWAVGCWFVPFVNLVKPLRIMQRIIEGLGGKGLAASLHLGVLWSVFLLSRVLAGSARRLSSPLLPPSLAIGVFLIEIGSWVCTLVAAILCVRMIRELQVRLESRRSGVR